MPSITDVPEFANRPGVDWSAAAHFDAVDPPTAFRLPPPMPPASFFPDRLPMPAELDPAAALAFRTPAADGVIGADGKAAGILTFLGLMFTVLARLGSTLGDTLGGGHVNPWFKALCLALLGVFALAALGTVIGAFRTIVPRFPKAEPSLAFFGDVAAMTREQYLAAVKALTPDAALAQMLAFNHTASLIVTEKYAQLTLAFRCFRLASICWGMVTAILMLHPFLR